MVLIYNLQLNYSVKVEVARLRSAIEMVEDGKSFLFQMDKITNRMRF